MTMELDNTRGNSGGIYKTEFALFASNEAVRIALVRRNYNLAQMAVAQPRSGRRRRKFIWN